MTDGVRKKLELAHRLVAEGGLANDLTTQAKLRRHGLSAMLQAAHELISEHHGSDMAQPLFVLMGALVELDHGSCPALLKPAKVRGPHRKVTDKIRKCAHAAAVDIVMLHPDHSRLDAALGKVARMARTGTTELRKARQRIMDGTYGRELREVHRRTIEHAKTSRTPPLDYARHLIAAPDFPVSPRSFGNWDGASQEASELSGNTRQNDD
jgi:hypothetical protein